VELKSGENQRLENSLKTDSRLLKTRALGIKGLQIKKITNPN
jgi:hypothetical protein